ncbi:MAG: hypothetical protein LBS37_11195 [Treponema sp.]|jgi:hypothetical protein|nr:hypothetical protein [Treponema sp.]
MKKNNLFSLAVCAALAAIGILCAACPTGAEGIAGGMGGDQGGTGTIRIGQGLDNNSRTAVPDAAELAGITFKVHLTGPGGTIDRDFGPEGGTIDVAAGSWNITVKAYNSEPRLRGMAEQTISVAPGGSQTISVTAVIGVKSEAEFLDVMDVNSAMYRYNDSDPSRENLIVVEQDFDINGFINISNSRKYTIIAEPGTTRTIRRKDGSGVGACINVDAGVLTLGKAGETGKLVFDGLGIAYYAANAFLYIYNTGSLIIDGNTEITRIKESTGYSPIWCDSLVEMRGGKITNCVAMSWSEGGAVSVRNGGQFTMSGGEISGNSSTLGGGGVTLMDNGRFTMNSGIISGNAVTLVGGDGGGVALNDNSQFIMSGGEISGNSSASGGGGVAVRGNGQFTMSGSGKISGNEATGTGNSGGGVALGGSGVFTMTGGEISGNSAPNGGGVALTDAGAFEMSGGKIIGNTANRRGGGVAVTDNGGFTLSGSAEISVNTAPEGGGVALTDAGVFDMNGGKISGNIVAGNGGGVYLAGNSTSTTLGSRTFTMTDGEISGNSATSGGGVSTGYIGSMNNDVNKFIMTGGIISGNTATSGGGAHIGSFYGSSPVKVIFAKRGGTIGANTAVLGNNEVYANVTSPLSRTTTAGPGVRLYIEPTSFSPTLLDPVGNVDTTSNWL